MSGRYFEMPTPIIFICFGMLVIGAAPLPYGYYTLLRLLTCIVFAVGAYIAYKRRTWVVASIYSVVALLFNPIIKVHFSKDIWSVVDVVTAVLLLATFKLVKNGG